MADYISIYTGMEIDAGIGKAETAYQKPNTGIPKTDLASDVQTSLGKADTALQTAPVTSVAGRTGAITLSKTDVGLGNVDNTADANKSVNYATSSGSCSGTSTYATYASSSSNTGMVLRNQGLVSSDTTPSNNGEINWTYA